MREIELFCGERAIKENNERLKGEMKITMVRGQDQDRIIRSKASVKETKKHQESEASAQHRRY